MPNPQYYRMMKDNKIVGFKRVTTEFLPIDGNKWQLHPLTPQYLDAQILSKYPKGINKIPPAMNWTEAIKHLNEIKSEYLTLPRESNWFPLGQIRHMEARWDDGERSEQLYKEIMALK